MSHSDIDIEAITEINIDQYKTNQEDYALWIDTLFKKINLKIPLPAIIISLIPFTIGLIISIAIDFLPNYLSTPPIYLGVFGLTWVSSFLNFGSKKFHEVYSEIRPCFLISDEKYSDFLHKWFTRMKDDKKNAIASLLLFLLAVFVVYCGFYNQGLFQQINSDSLRNVFPAYWYSPDYKLLKMLIIIEWAFFVSLLLGTSSRLLVVNFFFLLKLRQFPVIPIPNALKTRLKGINNFYILISTTWFVGVSLFGILLFDKLNLLSILVLSIFSFIGTFTFLTPQIIYKHLLTQSHKLASQWILYTFYKDINISLIEESISQIEIPLDKYTKKIENLKDFIEVSKQTDNWVYNPTDFLLLLLGQVLSFGSVFLENFLSNLI